MIEKYGKTIHCGYARGPRNLVSFPAAASQTFYDLSGKFVYVDSSNDVAIAASGQDNIIGWAEVGAITTSSTAGRDIITVDLSPLAQFWMPADATVSEDLRGETCDIVVNAGIQQADVGSSADDILLIVDIDIANTMVLVQMVSAVMQAKGVA